MLTVMTELKLGPLLQEPVIEALKASARLGRELAATQEILVRRARVQDASWAEIAGALGVSKQTVHRKYASRGLLGVRE